ncbi:MAG: hypothetical protein M3N18_01345 [Actinomycetota bacterium]|nr:hypothetical protein [Actinomycetota bacterium]
MTEGRGERATGTPDVTVHDPDDVVGGVTGGGSGERATGTPNTIYNLSSVLFHALQGGASYDTYIDDAERDGDHELGEFFRQVRDEDSNRADRAQQLLAQRTPTAAGGSQGTVTATTAEGAAAGVSSGTESTMEEDPSRAVERETATIGTSEEDLASSGAVPPEVPSAGEMPPGAEEAPPPRPEPSADFPGTEPVREDASTARTGEVPPPPEEIPPERAGEIPTAEEVPPPRAEGVPSGGEVPSGAPPGAVEPAVPGDIPHEDMVPPTPPPPRGEPGDVQRGDLPRRAEQSPRAREERAGQEEREEDKDLIDRAKDYLLGEDRERDYPDGKNS